MKIKTFDTTLRDGTQSPDVNLSVRDKMEIISALDEFGVDFIEAGWPGSNPKDMETFLEASLLDLKHAKIVAFGSTRRKSIRSSDDPNLNAIINSKVKVACIFGKTWIEHVKRQLQMTEKENLEAISDSVRFLKDCGLEVIYDAEHFFDGFFDDEVYALETLEAASLAGAKTLVLCDTNGGTTTEKLSEAIKKVQQFLEKNGLQSELGIHCHNDSGLAVANSLVAVLNGTTMVQGTINGLGERTGNADLCQLLPILALKYKLALNIKLNKVKEISDLVYTLANIKPNEHQPFVGKFAFSHKGGIHVDAIMKGASYEHISPELVGNIRQIILSDLSGKANIVEVLKGFGLDTDKKDPRVEMMLKKVELMEKKGYNIGGIAAEKYLLKEEFFGKNDIFRVISWKTTSEQNDGEKSECAITAKIDGEEKTAKSSVNGGPVDAMFNAVMKLFDNKPNVTLVNYKVMIAEDMAAESSVRVYIAFKNDSEEWGTVGVSTNILEASLQAIEKGFRYWMLKIHK